jgi:hypothetical protein
MWVVKNVTPECNQTWHLLLFDKVILPDTCFLVLVFLVIFDSN